MPSINKWFKPSFYLVLFILPSYFLTAAEQPAEIIKLTVGVNTVTFKKYPQYFHQNFCDNKPDFTKEQIDRGLLELLLICHAFATQNVTLQINYEFYPSYVRSIMMAIDGAVDLVSSSVWRSDLDLTALNCTVDVIRRGEFEKGIYTEKNHPMQKITINAKNIANYSGVTATTWNHDWDVISVLTKNRRQIEHWPSLFKMLAFGRYDFTLMEFPSANDLTISYENIILHPIQGIKVSMPDSRCFAISKKTPQGQKILKILNQGLELLRAEGKITQLYQQAGFFNQLTKDWLIISPKVIHSTVMPIKLPQ